MGLPNVKKHAPMTGDKIAVQAVSGLIDTYHPRLEKKEKQSEAEIDAGPDSYPTDASRCCGISSIPLRVSLPLPTLWRDYFHGDDWDHDPYYD